MNMANTTYNTTEEMINKLQHLNGKTKLKFYKNISNYYIEMKDKNFQGGQDPFFRDARGISKLHHGVILLMNFLQTKPQFKNMNNNYYDLYYTVIKGRDGNKDTDNQYEKDTNDYINFNDVVLNHYNGIKPRDTILK